jgi:cell wall-associated NlpC family hydrolase
VTAPIDTSFMSQVDSRITTIQAKISALASGSYGVTTAATAASSSATSFSAALAGASSALPSYSPALASTASGSASYATGATYATGDAIVNDAKQYLGIPYVWGGESTTGMDCSGLVQQTMKDLGITVPRTAAEQQQVGTAVPSLAQAEPGDLVFFGNPAHHVAIYLGNNQIIQAPQSGETVSIANLTETPTSIRRMVPSQATSSTGGLSSSQLTASGLNSAVATYATQFAAVEQKYNLPSGMLAAVAQQESGGNASAVSPAGAQGLMQLMPSTAASHGVNALDPTQAIDAAGSILAGNLAQFGSVPLALAAYNAGAGAVKQYGGIPPYTETQNYVSSVTSMMGRL